MSCFAIYKLQRNFFVPFISFLGVFIFYSNLVVGWESITGYVDLIRTFFEIMALWGFINWYQTKQWKWLVISAIVLGFAITTKLLAVGSILIFSSLIVWVCVQRGKNWFALVVYLLSFVGIALTIPLPWFIFSYLHTGNIVYPFFTNLYQVNPEQLSFTGFFIEIWLILIKAADPISPLYLIFLPLIILFFIKNRPKFELSLVVAYSLLAIIAWYFTPRTGGGRFLLPYLPAFSILCSYIYSEMLKKTKIEFVYLKRFLLGIIIFVSLISIGYRFVANSKYLSVILHRETKQAFLTRNLNFSFGDFYDTDNYLNEHIKQEDRVLLYGFHNLYYVDFPFIDSTWVKDDDTFNYIATQNTVLPKKYKEWNIVYTNNKTMIHLYKKPSK